MRNLYEAPSSKLVYFLAGDVLVNSSENEDDLGDGGDVGGDIGDVELP